MVDILKAIPGTASSQLLTSWISDIMLPFILQQLPLMLVSTVGISYRETCWNYYNITMAYVHVNFMVYYTERFPVLGRKYCLWYGSE